MAESLSIQTTANETASVQVVFEKILSDRWSHRIECVASGKTILIATSIEGSSNDNWPPSQPLQEISRSSFGDQPMLLGLGMAGRSHWSLSCSHDTDTDEQTGSILFDLACLVKTGAAAWLGSSYQLGPDITFQSSGDDWLLLKAGGDEILFTAKRADDWNTRFLIADDRLQIEPVLISKIPTVATRWAFTAEVREKPVGHE